MYSPFIPSQVRPHPPAATFVTYKSALVLLAADTRINGDLNSTASVRCAAPTLRMKLQPVLR